MNNQWAQIALAIGIYCSIIMVAICIFQIPVEIVTNGKIPIRIIIILIISISILSYATYLSESPKWKVAISYFLSVVCFSLIGIIGLGIDIIMNNIFGWDPKISIIWGFSAFVLGLASFFCVIKLMKTEWLKNA